MLLVFSGLYARVRNINNISTNENTSFQAEIAQLNIYFF